MLGKSGHISSPDSGCWFQCLHRGSPLMVDLQHKATRDCKSTKSLRFAIKISPTSHIRQKDLLSSIPAIASFSPQPLAAQLLAGQCPNSDTDILSHRNASHILQMKKIT